MTPESPTVERHGMFLYGFNWDYRKQNVKKKISSKAGWNFDDLKTLEWLQQGGCDGLEMKLCWRTRTRYLGNHDLRCDEELSDNIKMNPEK
jgi:hypothetical protein